jgi:thioredoxin 1
MDNQMPNSFSELINNNDVPVLVDFWAAWCGPCRMVSPVIARIASEFKGKLVTVKVNVDKKQHIAAQYQISSIPTIMMFFKGTVIMRITGALSYENLKGEVEKGLLSVKDAH